MTRIREEEDDLIYAVFRFYSHFSMCYFQLILATVSFFNFIPEADFEKTQEVISSITFFGGFIFFS